MKDLVNMELPLRKLKEDTAVAQLNVNGDKFPYGLRLSLEKEQIAKLPQVKDFNVKDRVLITAEASVSEVRNFQRNGEEESYSVSLQIEKMDVSRKKSVKEMSLKEYQVARENKEI
jgi:hypothetical protein